MRLGNLGKESSSDGRRRGGDRRIGGQRGVARREAKIDSASSRPARRAWGFVSFSPPRMESIVPAKFKRTE